MKRFVTFLMLAAPLLSYAQVDDIYFVPKKEKKVLVIKSSDESYFVDAEEYVTDEGTVNVYSEGPTTVYVNEQSDESQDNVYYTDNLGLFLNSDFSYSSRIVRFRRPDWTLGFIHDYSFNDWVIHDTGFSLDIYPTVSNPLYWSAPRLSFGFYNRWNYSTYFNTGFYLDNCWWHYYPDWHYHNHCWGNQYYSYNSWRPAHRVYNNIPANSHVYKRNRTFGADSGKPAFRERSGSRGGSLVRNNPRGTRRPGGVSAGNGKLRGEREKLSLKGNDDNRGGRPSLRDRNREDRRGKNVASGQTLRRQQPHRGNGAFLKKDRNERSAAGDNAGVVRKERQRPSREKGISLGGESKGRENGFSSGRDSQKNPTGTRVNRNDNKRRVTGTNTGSRHGRGQNSYGRSSSSRSYDRPSSTSVSRSRNGSSHGSGSSYRSSGSSRRNSSGGGSRGGSRSGRGR